MSDTKAKRLSGQALKDANHAISKLRKAGLYSGKKAIGQPTKYALNLIKKFSDVVKGLAKPVKVSRKTKEAYEKTFKTHGDKVIVPVKPQNSEIVRVVKSKQKGVPDEIRVYGDQLSGARYSRTLTARIPGKSDKLRSQEGPGVFFLVPIRRGKKGTTFQRFDRYDDAVYIIQEYVRRSASRSMSETDIREHITSWEAEIEVERTKAA
jgi:hypothetical protein